MEMMKKVGLLALIVALCAAGYYVVHNRMLQSNNVVIQWNPFKKSSYHKVEEAFKKADTTCSGGHDSECKHGQHCVDGTCRTGKQGTNCRRHGDCDDTLYCSDFANHTCQQRPKEGENCSYGPCMHGFDCESTNGSRICIKKQS